MQIPYFLVDNPLTPDPTDFRARLLLKGKKTRADILKRIMIKNSGLAESELKAVFDEEARAIAEFLEDGYSVDTGLVLIQPGVKGVFHSANEVFTPGKHELKINTRPLSALKEVLNRISLVKIVGVVNVPVITIIEDLKSQTKNDTMTPGKLAKIYGDKMKFDAEDAEQGIFFVKEDETETRVDEYGEIGNKKIIFNIPQGLAKGKYTLVIIGKTSAGELREGTFKTIKPINPRSYVHTPTR